MTVGVWGAGPGFYIVLPFLGPSTLRDTIGLVPDHFLDPISYLDTLEQQIAVRVYSEVNELSLDKDTYEGIIEEQLDPYLFIRDAYLQKRASMVAK